MRTIKVFGVSVTYMQGNTLEPWPGTRKTKERPWQHSWELDHRARSITCSYICHVALVQPCIEALAAVVPSKQQRTLDPHPNRLTIEQHAVRVCCAAHGNCHSCAGSYN